MTDSCLLFIHHRLVFKALRVVSTACLLGLICFVANANAQIEIDFRHDDGFFSSNPAATAALESAVSDINSVLNLNLGAVTDLAEGSSGGGTTVTFDFEYLYTNPATGASVTIANTAIAANEIRFFVGARTLGTNANGEDILGQGGPGGSGFSATGTVGSGSFQNAINDASANDTHRRGGGPVISQLSGAFDSGETFSFDFGLSIGSLVFDDDTDWHFDHTTAVETGKTDFYSVALHELLHAIGIGGSDTWNSLIRDSDWLGTEIIAVNGTGTGIVESDDAHFAENLMSTRISDGVLQEIVMDPNIGPGVRKGLTQFDVAALRDLGFSTVVPDVPLLGDVNLDGEVNFLDISPFISFLSMGDFLDEADINRDEEVNFLDISPFISILSAG